MIFTYIPHFLGYYFLKFLGKVFSKETKLPAIFKLVSKFIRSKLIIYFFAFLLVIISSIETYSGFKIIENKEWLIIKPYIMSAVVTFLAYDTFHNTLMKELKKIKKDICKIYKVFLSFIKSK